MSRPTELTVSGGRARRQSLDSPSPLGPGTTAPPPTPLEDDAASRGLVAQLDARGLGSPLAARSAATRQRSPSDPPPVSGPGLRALESEGGAATVANTLANAAHAPDNTAVVHVGRRAGPEAHDVEASTYHGARRRPLMVDEVELRGFASDGDSSTSTGLSSADADAVPQVVDSVASWSGTQMTWADRLQAQWRKFHRYLGRKCDSDGEPMYTAIDKALFLFGPESALRNRILRVTETGAFELVILIIIIANSIAVAFWDPLDAPDSDKNRVLDILDIVFTGVYLLEFLIKVVARGFALHERSYLRNPWNVLDFAILVLSLVALFPFMANSFSSLRLVRIVRPVRTLRGIPGMRAVVHALIESAGPLANVLVQYVFVFFIFGTTAINLWTGIYRQRCYYVGTDVVVDEEKLCSTYWNQGYKCLDGQECRADADNPNAGVTSFDNIFAAFLLIFQTMSQEDWSHIMYQTQDGFSEWSFLYFTILLLVASFILVHLALGVVIHKFTRTKPAAESGAIVAYTPSFFDTRPAYKAEEEEKYTAIRRTLRRIVTNKVFARTITVLIILNVLFLCVDHYNQPQAMSDFLEISNIFLMAVFVTVFLMRITAWGWRFYFADRLNVFDFTVIVVGVLEIILSASGVGAANSAAVFFKALRVTRIFKLVRFWRTLYELLDAIARSLATLVHLGMFLTLFVYIFALLGVRLFGGQFADEDGQVPRSNFDSVANALITVFQVLTSEEWPQVMHHAIQGTSWVASIYFLVLVMCGQYLIVNLFLTILVKNFGVVRQIFSRTALAQRRKFLQKVEADQMKEEMDMAVTNFINADARRRRSIFFTPDVGSGDEMGSGRIQEVFASTAGDGEPSERTGPIRSILRSPSSGALAVSTPPAERKHVQLAVSTHDIDRDVDEDARSASASESASGSHRQAAAAPAPTVPPLVSGSDSSSAAPPPLPVDDIASRRGHNVASIDTNASSLHPPVGPELVSTPGALRNKAIRSQSIAELAAMTASPSAKDEDGEEEVEEEGEEEGEEDEKSSDEYEDESSEEESSEPVSSSESSEYVYVTESSAPSYESAESDEAPSQPPRLSPADDGDEEEYDYAYVTDESSAEDDGAGRAASPTSGSAESERQTYRTEGGAVIGGGFTMSVVPPPATENEAPVQNKARSVSAPFDPAARRVSVLRSDIEGARGPGGGRRRSSTLASISAFRAHQAESVGRKSDAGAPASTSARPLGSPGNALHDTSSASLRRAEGHRKHEDVLTNADSDRASAIDRMATVGHVQGELGAVEVQETRRRVPDTRSVFLFGPDTALRHRLHAIVKHPVFEYTILMLILLACVTLALDHPRVEPGSNEAKAFFIVDVVVTTAFFIEAVMKIIVYGFLLHHNSYLRSPWNGLDFVILIVSIVGLFLSASALRAVKGGRALRVLRILRAIRPLRVIGQSSAIKNVFVSLLRAIPAISNVLFVGAIIWLIFAILGTQLYGGKFYSCNDAGVMHRSECVGLFVSTNGDGEPILTERRWRNAPYSFDHLGASLLTLFQVSTTEGWLVVMRSAIDAREVDEQPIKDTTPGHAVFFVAFIVIGAFFLLNLFVSVIIDNYATIKETEQYERDRSGLGALSTNSRLKWRQAFRKVEGLAAGTIANEYDEPDEKQPLRRILFNLVHHKAFEAAILVTILVNVVLMATRHYDMDESYETFLEVANLVFTVIFLLELIIKVAALGARAYFRDPWNRFDSIIVVVTVIGTIVDLAVVGLNAAQTLPTLLRIFRIFRLLRAFRLVKVNTVLRTMFLTFFYTLPSIINVGALLFLLMFIYAVWGMSFFGLVQRGEFLNEHANFERFPRALLTMFRILSGDRWIGIMWDASVQPPDCPADGEGCGSPFAPIFFVSFIIIGSFLAINLFVGLFLDSFLDLHESNRLFLTPHASRSASIENLFHMAGKAPPPQRSDSPPPDTRARMRSMTTHERT